MAVEKSLAGFYQFSLDVNRGRITGDPMQLAKLFRKYAGIERTPSLKNTLELVRSLGIQIEAVSYLKSGGANMTAKRVWYLHYSAEDRPATQKFTIFHELFEIIQKACSELDHSCHPLMEPQMSRSADRFSGVVLLPRQFFLNRIIETGCDLVKLSEGLELSYQCLMVAMEQHLEHVPFIGALYDYNPQDGIRSRLKAYDYVATQLVKTVPKWSIQKVCRWQSDPVLSEHPKSGSLVCAALHGGYPVFYHSDSVEDSAAVLVRPLFSGAGHPYRVIFLAFPHAKSNRFFPQVDLVQSVRVNEDSPCPSSYKCRNSHSCRWKTSGGYYEH